MQKVHWLIVAGLGLGLGSASVVGSLAWNNDIDSADDGTEVVKLKSQVVTMEASLKAHEKELALLWDKIQTLPASDRKQSPLTTESAQLTDGSDEHIIESGADSDDGSIELVTVEAVSAWFAEFVVETSGIGKREMRKKMLELADEFKEIGKPALMALVAKLESEDLKSRDRRIAATLLGLLQDTESIPALEAVVNQDPDVLVRRAAARGLRLLEAPEAIPILESLAINQQNDRGVRGQAAYGLARLGESQGVSTLVEIYETAEGSGEGRTKTFVALSSLDDPNIYPLMRKIAADSSPIKFRLEAIKYLSDHGDVDARPMLDELRYTQSVEPAIREAAQQAVTALDQRL